MFVCTGCQLKKRRISYFVCLGLFFFCHGIERSIVSTLFWSNNYFMMHYFLACSSPWRKIGLFIIHLCSPPLTLSSDFSSGSSFLRFSPLECPEVRCDYSDTHFFVYNVHISINSYFYVVFLSLCICFFLCLPLYCHLFYNVTLACLWYPNLLCQFCDETER